MGEYAEASRLTIRNAEKAATEDKLKGMLVAGSDDGNYGIVALPSALASIVFS